VQSERGLRRLVNFADAVVAIAITLLVLPLVDAAGDMGTTGVATFLGDNKTKLLAFLLSFVVIGRFWWGQHQLFERVISYNPLLVASTFLWLLSIVFLPFPTELLSASQGGGQADTHALYVGTLLVASIATLGQKFAVVHWPQLQEEKQRGTSTMDTVVIQVVLMAIAMIIAVVTPSQGMWALLLLLLATPIERLIVFWRVKSTRKSLPLG
jgi:uncharacterized membrane protein